MIGKTLSHYTILELLGAGGMGVVYRARDERLERDVALKVLPPHALANEEARKRFRKEALALSKLNHPNIATVFDFDHQDGADFLAMEFIAGESLAEKLARGSLSEKEISTLGGQIAAALEEAHEQGIVHRDLKPGNIMVTPKGHVKVLDFGLAKLLRPGGDADVTRSITETKAVSGTLPYMAPEQLRNEALDARTDIHALGAVLYEMATGKRVFAEESAPRLTDAILHRLPVSARAVNARIAPDLDRIFLKCLEKDPENRYQSAREVAVDLRRLAQATSATSVAPSAPSAWRGKRLAQATGVAVVAVAAVVLAFNVGGTRDRLLGRAGPLRIESIAVLPLENLSGDPSQEYFADGMTEALISNLAQVGALRVISRTSVMQYKGTRRPIRQIAKELDDVDAIIEGSVQRSGDHVKITVQLIAAATDTHLWARDYERQTTDVLSLQGEVSRAIAKEIRVELKPSEQARLASAHRVNPEAYDLFLRGRAHSRYENREDNDAAVTLLEQAVALDTELAPAHAELASAYYLRVFYFAPEEKKWQQRAFEEATRAMTLDPDSADAYLARGRLNWAPANHFAFEKAIPDFRRAIQLNPSLDEAHHQLGLIYLHIGRLEDAMREAQQAVKLNPGNTLALYRTGVVYLYQLDFPKAWGIFSKIPPDFNPSLVAYQNALTLFYLGRKSEATGVAGEYLKKYPQDIGGLLNSIQAILAADASNARLAEEKIKIARELGKGYGHFHHTMYNIASAYALLNRPADALKWLQAGVDDGFRCYPLFEKDPNLDRIRRDPAFAAFLAQQKKQWEKFKKL